MLTRSTKVLDAQQCSHHYIMTVHDTAVRLCFAAAGYVIANALVRLQGRTAMGAVKVFAECRPPGIYKRHYIEEIFRYNHELL